MRIILILAIFLGLGAAGLAYFKGSTVFEEQKADLAEVHGQVRDMRNQLEQAEIEVAEANEALESAKRTQAETEFELNSAADTVGELQRVKRQLEGQLTQLTQEMEDAGPALARLKEILEEAGIQTGGDIKPDEIRENIAQLDQEMSNRQAELEQLETRLATLEDQTGERRDRLTNLQDGQTERRRQLDLNTWSGSVTDVDPDWGIVVFRGGSSNGLRPGAKYIVTRGGARIADLEIVSMDANRTMANIVTDSLAAGDSVQAGDQVILSEPNSGR